MTQSKRIAFIAPLFFPVVVFAQGPPWWQEQGVLNTQSATDDYAIVVQGQVKHIAHQAYVEFDEKLPGGAGPAVSNLIAGFTLSNNYSFVNLGQLKSAATNFYDQLIELGITNAYPWAGAAMTDDFAIANVGQVKQLFDFDLDQWDTDQDGLPNWWEIRHGLDPNDDGTTNALHGASGDPDGDGLTNSNEYQNGHAPNTPTAFGDFIQEVQVLVSNMIPKFSNLYVEPTSSDLTNVNAMVQLLLKGEVFQTESIATSLNYEVVEFVDTNFNVNLFGVREAFSNGTNGWGSYYVHTDFQTDLLVQIPHPLFDINAWEIGGRSFLQSAARGS